MNKKRIILGIWATATMALCACSHEEEYDDPNRLADLNINTSIALARSYVGGTTFENDTLLAVYANNTTSNNTSNNYAVYKNSTSGWAYNGADKILLTAEDATIYAHYPAGGEYVITHNVAVDANSTLAIGLFEGSNTADEGNKIFVASGNKANINAAKGEVDFMYSAPKDDGSHPTANNGKKSGGDAKAYEVTLTMRHAMSMVSFRVYNDKTYTHTGSLTKIQLKNKDGKTTLNKGTSATMKLGDGAITISGSAAATFTRFIYTGTSGSSTAGFTLGKFDNATAAKEQTPAFSMLVYPESTADKSTIEAVFTVDDTDYPVALPASGQAWEKGKNYIYTVKLNGKELELGTVTIVAWEATEIGELVPVQ